MTDGAAALAGCLGMKFIKFLKAQVPGVFRPQYNNFDLIMAGVWIGTLRWFGLLTAPAMEWWSLRGLAAMLASVGISISWAVVSGLYQSLNWKVMSRGDVSAEYARGVRHGARITRVISGDPQ